MLKDRAKDCVCEKIVRRWWVPPAGENDNHHPELFLPEGHGIGPSVFMQFVLMGTFNTSLEDSSSYTVGPCVTLSD